MTLVLELDVIDRSAVAEVGAKAAQLAELRRIDGIDVPPGFVVTTAAFERAVTAVPTIAERIERLSLTPPGDLTAIGPRSAEVRRMIEAAAVPADVTTAITESLARYGNPVAVAVRSSGTAEDLPGASFAGQHDSYLDVVGPDAVLQHVRRCWASLFSERAVVYRRHHGFDDREVRIAVVVQQMVAAEAAGVLFTADPVTSDRRVAVVEATPGLGEVLVAGLVRGETHRVRDDAVVETAGAPGGTAVLTGEQVVDLVRLGRRIEAHFGCPQDIEWCFADGGFAFVQSRPITTLFPVPDRIDDAHHVYLSVGHQQMMTDAMRPLGLAFWQLTTPAPMAEAGGRLFVDITARLASPGTRAAFLELLGRSDPLILDALRTVLGNDGTDGTDGTGQPVADGPAAGVDPAGLLDPDPAVVTELIRTSEQSVAAARRAIAGLTGPALLEFIRADLQELRRILFDPRSHQVFMTAIEASWWLNERLAQWLGEINAADTLTRSVPHNVTSEMGLALLDVADAIRPHPEVVAFLQDGPGDDLLDRLTGLAGGADARAALAGWLDRYGMRCAGEIDITRPRWSERPSTLVPVLLAHVRDAEPGSAGRRFERGRQEARQYEQELLDRLRTLPDGEARAVETHQMIERVRTFIGYREYPKYGMVSRYFVYKQALTAEAARLVAAHVLHEADDVFYLGFDELDEVVRTQRVDHALVRRRRDAFRAFQALTAPRVLTSDGEALDGAHRRGDAPPGALVGLAVSAGTVEGRARVVTDMARADLAAGDILVTRYTDPSWTPLFLTAGGVVTEVGGLMTHGAVVAREYGLPGVVGVERATRLIRDGQRIRVDGTAGYVELLD